MRTTPFVGFLSKIRHVREGPTGGHGCNNSGAHQELNTGREREGFGLVEVEVRVEVLTVGPIELWWSIAGDR